jgi:predicted MFS family arabinose efflux permease
VKDAGAGPEPAATQASPGYANYVLGVLFLAYVLNFVDRQILAILLESIKRDLELSDTVMGLLTGTVFAVFYSVLGVPIARWADLWVRRTIVAIGLALWSGMTAASGLAQNLAQLAAARIGVGVGEAALSPPAHSLLADYFPPERRATALSIYAMGIHFGILFGLTVGGWLDDTYGWRIAFLAVGLPGVALALLVRLTLREPPRAAHAEPPPVAEVFRFLWRLPSFRHASFATALTAFAGYAFANWAPTFLRRVHELSSTEAGNLGYAIGIGGAVGSLVAGLLADRLGRGDQRFWLWVPACAALGPVPFLLTFLFHGDPGAALWWLLPGLAIAAFYQGPVFATVQTLAPASMRSVAAGVLLLIINIIGLGLGPPTVGWLSEHVFAERGVEAVRYSLAAVAVAMGVWGCLHFLLAARTLRADLRAKEAGPGP